MRDLARPAPWPAPRPRRARAAPAAARAPTARAAPASRCAPRLSLASTSRYVATSTTGRSISAGARKSASASDGASAAWRSSRTRNSGWRAAAVARWRRTASKRVKRSAPSASGGSALGVLGEDARQLRGRVEPRPAQGAHDLHPRPECRRSSGLPDPAPGDEHPPRRASLVGRLVGEPRLSDTRLAGDGDDSAAPLARRLGGGRQDLELTGSFDEKLRQHGPSLAPHGRRKVGHASGGCSRCARGSGPADGVLLPTPRRARFD